MAESKSKNRHAKPVLSAEEIAKRNEERKAEEERLKVYGASVPKMSHRQVVSELKKQIRSRFVGKPPVLVGNEGLNVAEAVASLIVLENTITVPAFETDEKGNVTRVARMDQINRLGYIHSYPQ